jgi:dihydrofolate synthase/folylpolyglutamate synthase
VHWGLERVRHALEALGNPHRSFRSLHVGGTNGKGSVAVTLAAVLDRMGHRTGCYTSPHLCSFRERVVVGGRALDEDLLMLRAEEIREAVVRFGLTFFEAATVLGFHAFAQEDVDVGVVEVGLGGRLDATNVLTPMVSAITNVADDHQDYLGETLMQIGREKAGIIKPGVPLVTAETDTEVLAMFREVASSLGSPVFSVRPEEVVRELEVATDHTAFTLGTSAWGEVRVRTPLVGRHQAANAALAVAILERSTPSSTGSTRWSTLDGTRSSASGRRHGSSTSRTIRQGSGPWWTRWIASTSPARSWPWSACWGTRTGGACFPPSSPASTTRCSPNPRRPLPSGDGRPGRLMSAP